MSHSPSHPVATASNYYEILGISPSLLDTERNQQAQLIKRAYHRALLRHHPDKAKSEFGASDGSKISVGTSTASEVAHFTIDQITNAYKTLSSPSSRKAYEALLKAAQNKKDQQVFQTGVENVDLDDLEFDEEKDVWHRSCRCGNDRGFLLGEGDLEEAGEMGELLVGCQDCSLWMKVHFAVMDN
ncbi:CSL zinc finger [Verticillium dahliae]